MFYCAMSAIDSCHLDTRCSVPNQAFTSEHIAAEEACHDEKPTESEPGNRTVKVPGICRRYNRNGDSYKAWYSALVSLNGLDISSRCTPDLPMAVDFLIVLTAIKHRALSCSIGWFEDRVRHAIQSAMKEHKLSASDQFNSVKTICDTSSHHERSSVLCHSH